MNNNHPEKNTLQAFTSAIPFTPGVRGNGYASLPANLKISVSFFCTFLDSYPPIQNRNNEN